MNKLYMIILLIFFYSCSNPTIMHHEGESCDYDTECIDGLSCIDKVCSFINSCTNHSDCINSDNCTDNSCLCKLGKCTPYFPCEQNLCSDNELCSEVDSYPFYECSCEENYILNEGICEFDCTHLVHSHTNSSNSGCSCDENYIPEEGKCIFNCNDFPFRKSNESNDGCICKEEYREVEDQCIFICGEFSIANDTNDGCDCITEYLKDENNNCLYDCSYDLNSQINETNDGCICKSGWKLNNGICIFVCEQFSHVNETNDGCSCNDGYKLVGDSCVFNCDNIIDSHVNETNDGCICNDGTTDCFEDNIHYAFVKYHPSGSISSASNTITFKKFRIVDNSVESVDSVIVGSFKNQQDKYDMFYSYDDRPYNGITRYNHESPYEMVNDGYFFPATSKERLIEIITEAISNGECAKSPDNFAGGNLNRDDNFWTNFCPKSGLILYIQNSDL